MILAGIGLSLLCIGIALMLWLPSHSLVQDLRSDGVNAAATVIAVDNKPKYVKVRLVSGPEAGEEVNLSDYAGMYPDTRTGDAMIVTYDPADPSRILQRSWVEDPPVSLQTFIASASGLFLLVLDVIVIIRRYRMLRRPETPGPEGVSLTKP
ncbi:hypothetical protein QNN03_34540 [Streptomyces sp. GXMU-J15]|uniref:DUF3592 domain-containing protein n=1 Tax=Streptomyces fuscus TaxID=3048495 RepID=A0ABT7J9K1_9ACTN|nr:DUF3592 domain-containing protein [Streptomyces fuscus]MDL2081561.1 hypothetical protein [Streptomyces fuscus]